MNPISIREVKEEISGLDALIKEAIADRDLEEATRLESRKRVLPQLLEQFEKNAAQLEGSLDKLKEIADRHGAKFADMLAQNKEAEHQIRAIKKALPTAEEYTQAQSYAISTRSKYDGVRRDIERLRG